MAHVNNWSGVLPGGGRVENPERAAQTANYNREAQRHIMQTAFAQSAAPTLGLG